MKKIKEKQLGLFDSFATKDEAPIDLEAERSVRKKSPRPSRRVVPKKVSKVEAGLLSDPSMTFETFLGNSKDRFLAIFESGLLDSGGLVTVLGPSGVGKSHLLHALEKKYKSEGKEVALLSGPRMKSILQKGEYSFWNDFDCIIIDDAQELFLDSIAGPCSLLDEWESSGRSVILGWQAQEASDWKHLSRPLYSRLQRGVVFCPTPLEKELYTDYFYSLAKKNHLDIPSEGLKKALTPWDGNGHTAKGLLLKAITNPSGQDETSHFEAPKRVNCDQETVFNELMLRIAQIVSLEVSDLLGPRRPRKITAARIVLVGLARDLYGMRPWSMAPWLQRDHTSLLYFLKIWDKYRHEGIGESPSEIKEVWSLIQQR